MTPQLWVNLATMYLPCWALGRMFAGTEEREHMGTCTLSDTMKLLLFLPPKTRLRTFTLRSIIYMVIINGALLVQLVLAVFSYFEPSGMAVRLIENLRAFMGITLFIHMCIALCAVMVHSVRQWSQKRKIQEEIEQKGGLFLEKSDDPIQVPEHFLIKAPKMVFYIGLANILFSGAVLILMTVFPNDTATWWVYVLCTTFLLLGAWLCYFAVRWRITVDHDNIQITTLVGKEKTYSRHEITGAVLKNQALIVYKGTKKLFDLAPYFDGFVPFVDYLQSVDIPIEIKQ